MPIRYRFLHKSLFLQFREYLIKNGHQIIKPLQENEVLRVMIDTDRVIKITERPNHEDFYLVSRLGTRALKHFYKTEVKKHDD